MTEGSGENSQELITDFVDEAVESLRPLASHLDAYRRNPSDADPINAVFRSVHSIKGCAGFLGLAAVKMFSHAMENTMDEVRKQKVSLSEDLQLTLVNGIDLLDAMLQRALDGEIETDLGNDEKQLLDGLERLANDCRLEQAPEEILLAEILKLAEEIGATEVPQASQWAMQVQQLVEVYRNNDAEEKQEAAPSKPNPSDYVGVTCKCNDEDISSHIAGILEVFLVTERGEYKEAAGKDFMRGAEEFAVWADGAGQAELAAALRAGASDFRTIFDSPLDIDATLISVVWDHLSPELSKLEGAPGTQAEAPSAETKQENAADQGSDKSAADSKVRQQKIRMVRVKEEYVDGFLNDVSRLFITGELLKDLHSRMSHEGAMQTLVEEMRQINTAFYAQSASLQQSVVSLRRVSVSGLFAKFPRMARTLCAQLNKKIAVHLVGEETEIDKSLLEDLDAPLTHMIRNSVDHGIETPEERKARGVDETGNLWLKAEQTRSHVIITIQDDGRGIDPVKLRNKAVEKGIYSREEADHLSDEETLKLVFHAGFSTAEKLSDVSGRGVGMDVVRTNLAHHNGEIFVESKVGQGSIFRMEIPIRDAVLVIDGLMMKQNGEDFALPFDHIREITEIDPADLSPVQGSQVATIRGKTYEAVELCDILDLEKHERQPGQKLQAVLVGCKLGEVCILVDKVCGHRQIVLNSINDILPETDKIAGVAQLGGGRLALVLSVEDIVKSLGEGVASV